MADYNVGPKIKFPSIQSVNMFVNSTKYIGKGSTVEVGGNKLFVVDVISDTEIKICPIKVGDK